MRKAVAALAAFVVFAAAAQAAEIHVAVNGKDSNPGTPAAPLRTIQRAADLAQPGDVVTVHAGVYRERISPPRGGESDAKRIIYQAAPGEKVEIKGSEVVKDWVKVEDDVWKVTVPNSFFGDFNPFSDLIRGDWFEPKGREHHTGAVYLDGEWLTEAAKLDDAAEAGRAGSAVVRPGGQGHDDDLGPVQGRRSERAPGRDQRPARPSSIPRRPGVNYITVRGFIMRHAATPWAPPTAEQIGLIGTHWSKGWIIENNIDQPFGLLGHRPRQVRRRVRQHLAQTRPRATSRRSSAALASGWNKDNDRPATSSATTSSPTASRPGIVGSLGAAFSTVTGNTIHDIHVRQLFTGAEMAGIKFHAAIDVEISRNHIYRTVRGLWLDWMAQGTRVTGNLFHDNPAEDLFVEVDHGPFLVDNNIFLSPRSLLDVSQGGAYVHNLIAGEIRVNAYDARQTPFHKAHSTELAGMHDNPFGDDQFFNNVFVGRADLSVYDKAPMPVRMDGNVFLTGAKPSKHEREPVVKPEFEPGLKLVEKPDGFYLEFVWDKTLGADVRRIVTTALLGKAAIPDLPYEQADGKAVRFDVDFFGQKRNAANPMPGPFEDMGTGRLSLKVW